MAGPTVTFQTGNHAGRPAASSGCVLYSCTDHDLVYRSDGTTWTTWATLGGGIAGITIEEEGSPLTTDATTIDFTGAGVTATGSGATKTVNIPGGGGGLTLPEVIQCIGATSGVGTPTVTIAQPATTSLLIMIGAVNGSGPTSITHTNWTWTNRRSDGYGGVGDLEIWTGVYDGSGTPGTSVAWSGASSANSSQLVMEVANTDFSSLGASSSYAGDLSTNHKQNPVSAPLTPAVGSIVAFIVHTGASGGLAPGILSCPFITNLDDNAHPLSLGYAIGLPVTGHYSPAAKPYTLAEIILT